MSITFTALPADADQPGLPELTVGTANAYALLRLLGLMPPDGRQINVFGLTVVEGAGEGELDAADFLGRVLLAQALLDAGSTDAVGEPAYSVGNVTYCGRRPGYLAEKLGILADIAAWAVQHQAMMRWY